MKRRQFLTSAGLASGAAAALAAPAIAQSSLPNVTWRLQSSYPKSLATLFGTCTYLSELVAGATDGRFTIQAFAAGEIVPALQVADAVGNATVEMGQTGSYFYIGKDMGFAFGTAIPWGMNSRQQNAWMHQGGGLDLMNEFYAQYGIFNLPSGNTGTQMGGWFRKEIKSVADLKGLKMRIGGLGGNVLQKLGVIPQQLGAGDIYPALEKGVIDSAEFVGPYDDEKLGFVKVAPYYYYPAFWEGGAELSFFINVKAWASLPKSYQEILRTACRAAAQDMQNKYDVLNPPALKRLIQQGAQLRPLPQDIMRASYKAAHEMYGEISQKSAAFKKIYDHQLAFQRESQPWWSISDLTYDLNISTAMQQGWEKG
ncbi:MAG: TRAP transporter substrate-binding protein DctP [Proteobacteria bacterium]|nr:TRAP transporter substrate-binding protein DctP [Pseudomonadota bacterium]